MKNLPQLKELFSNGKEVLCDGCEFEGLNVNVLLYQYTDEESIEAQIAYHEFEDIMDKYFEAKDAYDTYFANPKQHNQIHADIIELIKFKIQQEHERNI